MPELASSSRSGSDSGQLSEQVVEREQMKMSVESLGRTLDLMFESFDSDTSSVVLEIFGLIDDAEASHAWDVSSDPELEGAFVSMVDEIVSNPGQLPEIIKRRSSGLTESIRQSSIDEIGGPGTLREIWARLKSLEKVCGVKRKLSERDWGSTASTASMSVPSSLPELASSSGSGSDSGQLSDLSELGTSNEISASSLGRRFNGLRMYSSTDSEQDGAGAGERMLIQPLPG